MQHTFIHAAGHQINTAQIGRIDPDKPTLVFIHGGLDCIEMWRKFPAQLAEATGLAAIVYDRWGHGKSDPLEIPRAGDPREDEASQPLLDLFNHFGLKKVILVGHSFGGAVSLIAASKHTNIICGVVSIAPQLVMHQVCIDGVGEAEAAFKNGKLRDKLIAFHGENTDIMFFDWAGRSKTGDFQRRSYAEDLKQIQCPVLEIFGKDDNYGYMPNLELSQTCISSRLEVTEVPEAGHYPHLETPETVINVAVPFIASLTK